MEQTREIQYLNKVEVIGRVGTIRTTLVGNFPLCRFTVATQFAYCAKDGSRIEETQWHSVSFFGKEGGEAPDIKKGDAVRVIGRTRMNRYTGTDGSGRIDPEILASSVENYGVETILVSQIS